MKKIEIKIADVIKTDIAYENKAPIVERHFNRVLSEISQPTLFVINFERLSILDYKLIVYGFQELFDRYETDSHLYLAIKSSAIESDEIMEGLVFMFKLHKEQGTDIEILTRHNHNLVLVDYSENFRYISSLNDVDLSVLKEIETTQNISSSIIQEKFSLIPEQTVPLLRRLLDRKVIYETEGPVYNSIKSLVLNESNG